jgi:curved DNA-binding protein CbpA
VESPEDYYAVLGVKRGASQDEIKRAYRKAVFRYHPDRNPGDDAAAGKFKQVLDAYEVLSDSSRRANYDQVTRFSESEPQDEQEDTRQKDSQFDFDPSNGFHFTQDFGRQEFKQGAQSEPKCPSCAAVGVDHIVSRKGGATAARGKQFVLSPFNIIFCSACGHVYGVTPAST